MTVPLRVFPPELHLVAEHAQKSPLPLWTPWPLPSGWQLAGHGFVGDLHDATATVVATRGPHPLGADAEVADLLVVAEEPDTGLGGALAGLDSTDPGPGVGQGAPHFRTEVAGHPAPLWWVPSAAPDRAVYAGEAAGCWLWLVLLPASAGALLVENLCLADVRDLKHEVDLVPYGHVSPYLDLESGTS
jgi:hypothetical protein